MDLLHKLVTSALPLVPTPLMRRLSARYIAGETIEDALARLADLNARGYDGILDILGEDVTGEREAREVAQAYRDASDRMAARGVRAYPSIKPTHLGLRLSEELAYELYAEVAEHVARHGMRVRVEMEDHTTTDATLRVFERLRPAYPHVGVVLQSRLHRTPRDVEALAPGPLDVRLVKGVYLEPASIAHVDPEAIRDAFVACSRRLLERGAFVAFATHDDGLAERCLALCRELGRTTSDYELEVLLGVREPLWARWREAGHRVRVYVPYGPHWRPYSLRRLKKNPEILRHVLRDTLRLGERETEPGSRF